MNNKPFLTKDRQGLTAGTRQTADIKFRPASDAELKDLGDDLPEGYVAGWASTSDLDHYRHIVEPGAFTASINEKGLDGPRGIKLLIQHDSNRPGGKIVKLEQRPQGLWIEAQLNLNISYVKDMYEAAKMQGGMSFSVGFFLEEFEWVETEEGFEHLKIIKGELTEVSVVTFPGNDNAEMTYIKTRDGEEPFPTVAAFEKALVASGVAKSRRDANRVVRWIKGLQLESDAPKEEPPLSASTTKALDDIGGLLDQLKTSLA